MSIDRSVKKSSQVKKVSKTGTFRFPQHRFLQECQELVLVQQVYLYLKKLWESNQYFSEFEFPYRIQKQGREKILYCKEQAHGCRSQLRLLPKNSLILEYSYQMKTRKSNQQFLFMSQLDQHNSLQNNEQKFHSQPQKDFLLDIFQEGEKKKQQYYKVAAVKSFHNHKFVAQSGKKIPNPQGLTDDPHAKNNFVELSDNSQNHEQNLMSTIYNGYSIFGKNSEGKRNLQSLMPDFQDKINSYDDAEESIYFLNEEKAPGQMAIPEILQEYIKKQSFENQGNKKNIKNSKPIQKRKKQTEKNNFQIPQLKQNAFFQSFTLEQICAYNKFKNQEKNQNIVHNVENHQLKSIDSSNVPPPCLFFYSSHNMQQNIKNWPYTLMILEPFFKQIPEPFSKVYIFCSCTSSVSVAIFALAMVTQSLPEHSYQIKQCIVNKFFQLDFTKQFQTVIIKEQICEKQELLQILSQYRKQNSLKFEVRIKISRPYVYRLRGDEAHQFLYRRHLQEKGGIFHQFMLSLGRSVMYRVYEDVKIQWDKYQVVQSEKKRKMAQILTKRKERTKQKNLVGKKNENHPLYFFQEEIQDPQKQMHQEEVQFFFLDDQKIQDALQKGLQNQVYKLFEKPLNNLFQIQSVQNFVLSFYQFVSQFCLADDQFMLLWAYFRRYGPYICFADLTSLFDPNQGQDLSSLIDVEADIDKRNLCMKSFVGLNIAIDLQGWASELIFPPKPSQLMSILRTLNPNDPKYYELSSQSSSQEEPEPRKVRHNSSIKDVEDHHYVHLNKNGQQFLQKDWKINVERIKYLVQQFNLDMAVFEVDDKFCCQNFKNQKAKFHKQFDKNNDLQKNKKNNFQRNPKQQETLIDKLQAYYAKKITDLFTQNDSDEQDLTFMGKKINYKQNQRERLYKNLKKLFPNRYQNNQEDVVAVKIIQTKLFRNESNVKYNNFLKKLPFYNLSSLYMDSGSFKLLFMPQLIDILKYSCNQIYNSIHANPIRTVKNPEKQENNPVETLPFQLLWISSQKQKQFVWKDMKNVWNCSCGRQKLYLMPCRHILKGMLDRQYKMLDSIHSFWHKK